MRSSCGVVAEQAAPRPRQEKYSAPRGGRYRPVLMLVSMRSRSSLAVPRSRRQNSTCAAGSDRLSDRHELVDGIDTDQIAHHVVAGIAALDRQAGEDRPAHRRQAGTGHLRTDVLAQHLESRTSVELH